MQACLRALTLLLLLTLLWPGRGAAAAAQPDGRDWVGASNAHTRIVLEAQAAFAPEFASHFGLTRYDGLAADLGPRFPERNARAMRTVIVKLRSRLSATRDPNVRQDLRILIDALRDDLARSRLERRHELLWIDAPELLFGGLSSLLDEQVAPARRARALDLLQRYVGLHRGSRPLTEQARERFVESRAPGRLGPVRANVEQSIANAPAYAREIRERFARFGIAGAGPALDLLDRQVSAFGAWQRATVLPLARDDFRSPQVYEARLRSSGIDIAPARLIERARLAYMEARAALQALAPQVARARGLPASDYPAVIRALKRETIADDRLVARYAEVNAQLEAIIRRERIVDLPTRPLRMRLATAAETAAQPAPHMQIPPLIDNTGQQGEFVLPVANPTATGPGEAYDDFNHPAATWTLSAHEGRPGHELQFAAMLAHGVSLARSLYAFNNVNVEGWALYAEAEMLPHEPIEGQLIALQLRLLRAARAMLDPMLNLGWIGIDDARRVLAEQVVLSPAFARQEIERYTFRSPGQAGSYFYGYARLLELRAETELALGPRFDRLAFNNFLLQQGLLAPSLLAAAVRERFVPAQRARP